MKALLAMFICCTVYARAQTMTAEEKALRKGADFAVFMQDVKTNSTQGCMCNKREYVVFSFTTTTKKTASLCISKNASAAAGYLVYRFGSKTKTEFSFPADTLNAFSKFSFGHYYRGGGKQNAAMYINSLHFANGDYTYTLHDDWNSEDDHYAKGIIVINHKTKKTIAIKPKGKVTGTLSHFAGRNLVPETDEL